MSWTWTRFASPWPQIHAHTNNARMCVFCFTFHDVIHIYILLVCLAHNSRITHKCTFAPQHIFCTHERRHNYVISPLRCVLAARSWIYARARYRAKLTRALCAPTPLHPVHTGRQRICVLMISYLVVITTEKIPLVQFWKNHNINIQKRCFFHLFDPLKSWLTPYHFLKH